MVGTAEWSSIFLFSVLEDKIFECFPYNFMNWLLKLYIFNGVPLKRQQRLVMLMAVQTFDLASVRATVITDFTSSSCPVLH